MSPPPLQLSALDSAWRPAAHDETALRQTVQILKGHAAVLAARPLLRGLAERCGQAGEIEPLEYFFLAPENLRKTPYLLLFGARSVQDESLVGAVLVFEYRIGFAGTRIFATADGSGRRNVWAPIEERAQLAAQAARTLMERGAEIVQIAYPETFVKAVTGCQPGGSRSIRPRSDANARAIAEELDRARGGKTEGLWTLFEREMPHYLPLCATMDATLARIGQRTRSNLRYYRRRCERDLGCVFVRDVTIGLEELQEFNRQCSFTVEEQLLTWRFSTLRMDGVFLHGIRDRTGRWLSLVCGRRHNGFVEIDWQMNRAEWPAHSLSLVMRAFLIEHEIAQGSSRLYIEGGTFHPIAQSFVTERVGELTLKRESWIVRALERFGKRVFPVKNYLGQTLRNPELKWRRWPRDGSASR